MTVTYTTTVIGAGNHASLHIPDEVLSELGTHRRAPLKITVNGHTYQSTATGVGGQCRVVFPQRERRSAGVHSGDTVTVTLQLDSGYRHVEVPEELGHALAVNNLNEVFAALSYSRRKECARLVAEAKTEATRNKRITRVLDELRST